LKTESCIHHTMKMIGVGIAFYFLGIISI